MLERPLSLRYVVTALSRSPVTALLGPRQCGKTTLARMLGRNRKLLYFDLEHEADRSRLQNPDLALGPLRVLTGTFLVRQLQPWHTNVARRQVKAPKIYLRDSGLLQRPLGIEDRHGLLGHPQAGASWEGFALEQTLAAIRPAEAHFWSMHGGAELDLFFIQGGHRFGIEFTLTDAPAVTRSMRIALDDLKLRHLWVIHAGRDRFPMDEAITAWPLREVTGLATHINSPGGRGPRRPRLES